ncbi:MAG TPA: MEDS domain-containing protein [Terriglobia bacterium]|nr:MEDS domain-containing protein [Terriglobia bacterium]
MPMIEKSNARCASSPVPCRVVVRKDQDLSEISRFVIQGLQIGQQVVTMAGPAFLRELAHELTESGLKPEGMLRNGRLVFLTAPNCLSALLKPDESLQRGPLRSNAPLLRWVSDWSWAYGKSVEPTGIVEFQRRIHDFIRSLDALSVCTVQNAHLDRNSMLALLADHRRASKAGDRALRAPGAMLTELASD